MRPLPDPWEAHLGHWARMGHSETNAGLVHLEMVHWRLAVLDSCGCCHVTNYPKFGFF